MLYPGQATSDCTVAIVEDNLSEGSESFQLILATPTSGDNEGKLGDITEALITITDPVNGITITIIYIFNKKGHVILGNIFFSSSNYIL